MDLTTGQQIGTYRIVRLLGKGGMGAVYEVEHMQLGVHYALKTFTLEEGHVEVLKNKFLTEGKVLARLHDPRLVRVFDLNFDETTGMPYFVMDLVLSEDGKPRPRRSCLFQLCRESKSTSVGPRPSMRRRSSMS